MNNQYKEFRKLSTPYLIWLLVLVCAPLIIMFSLIFLNIEGIDYLESSFTLNNFSNLTQSSVMPKGKGAGYRIVTKEQVDTFGELYPLSAVEKIQKKLTEIGSQWRVPSKDDWDELLNAMEINPESRNHNNLKKM